MDLLQLRGGGLLHPSTTRRRALLGLATAGLASTPLRLPTATVAAELPPNIVDFAQLTSAYQALNRAVDDWPSQVALMQLGRPTEVQAAIETLSGDTLRRLGQGSGAADVGAFLRTRDDLLRLLYLAQGGTKYEGQETGLKYMADAKEASKVAKDRLEALAKLWKVL